MFVPGCAGPYITRFFCIHTLVWQSMTTLNITMQCSSLLSADSTSIDVMSIKWSRWFTSSSSRLTWVNFVSKSTGRWNLTNLVDTSAKCRYIRQHNTWVIGLEQTCFTHSWTNHLVSPPLLSVLLSSSRDGKDITMSFYISTAMSQL